MYQYSHFLLKNKGCATVLYNEVDMITFPNAKINLGLNIVEKRSDGYHNLETIFYPIRLNDMLELVPTDGATMFYNVGEFVECENIEDNLIYKAYKVLASDYVLPPFAAYLKKTIPTGAGLGGGSADAAYMIKMINDYAGLGLDDEEMERYAVRIGADCAFFIKNRVQYAEGIGNEFGEVDLDLRGYKLLLVKPRIHVSTKEAYAHTMPKRWVVPLKEAVRRPIEEWKDCVYNDFEESVFKVYPRLGEIKDDIYKLGAIYASMSGSGSSVFGIFAPEAEEVVIESEDFEGVYWMMLG